MNDVTRDPAAPLNNTVPLDFTVDVLKTQKDIIKEEKDKKKAESKKLEPTAEVIEALDILKKEEPVKKVTDLDQDASKFARMGEYLMEKGEKGVTALRDFVKEDVIDPLRYSKGRLKGDIADPVNMDEMSGLDMNDPRVLNRKEKEGQYDSVKEQFEKLRKPVGEFVGATGDKIRNYIDENPEAFLEIAGGLEDSILSDSRQKVDAANTLAANFGLRGKIGRDGSPSAIDRMGRNMVSDKLKAQEDQKQEAQQRFNDKYAALLDAKAGYLDRGEKPKGK